MLLSEYFEKAQGRGVMATADSAGRPTAAVYARPHFFGEDSVAFIMADRLMHYNLQSNPHAVYLFMESGEAYAGRRLYLTKTREEVNSPLIEELRRRCPAEGGKPESTRYLVHFSVDRVLPLVGDGE
ncbi:MAG: pyridoxamine 5'-phosphate oxidase family protein [Acidobacteria bacterium]|nr:pyridoxamine 5'-phosphate oxidase family protein [Acidobacteriota bacterium]